MESNKSLKVQKWNLIPVEAERLIPGREAAKDPTMQELINVFVELLTAEMRMCFI